ncbi:MAG: glycoside hydrolase family 5 protein [bacterium]|nr:glycoside hydrolase family 5 protein [bacterium]
MSKRTWKKRTGCLLGIMLLGIGMLAGCGGEKTPKGEMRTELTSLEFVEMMGNGINLGNTMEAYGHLSLGTEAEVSAYETLWGVPETTQEMVTGMHEAGFDTLRIPVAWTNMMNYESGDYTINEAYLDRVEEIINYALSVDMYVIVNDHWDGSWWGMFGSATQETRDQAMELYISMWTQIAERYRNYSDHLIFESANEELGNRLNDTDVAKDSGALSPDECYETMNRINQNFVDTVRATGGNNEQRFLLIAGYNTDISMTCDSRFAMPTDEMNSENPRLLLSVHYYDPSGYCINTSLPTWGSTQDYEEQNEKLSMLEKFTSQGYGVVIGEYGVLIENVDHLKENTVEYLTNFLANCDYYGYCPVLWDCSNMYNRNTCKIIDSEVAALYTEHSYGVQASMSKEEIRQNAQTVMAEALAASEPAAGLADDEAVAWIMYNSGDWNLMYSVGDVYQPDDKTEGIVASDVAITGEGTYTVSLDFTGTSIGYADSVAFAAVAVGNGETLFPGYVISINEILINGEPYRMMGKPYTSSDDGICTRTNLYNAWVPSVPAEARTVDGSLSAATPNLLDADTLGHVETIEVTFFYKSAD